MKRDNPYQPTPGISTANEPSGSLKLDVDFRQYPDMRYMYQKFSKWLDIPMSQFILANGAENAMKNVLCALKPKSIHWSIPTWGLVDVFCAQFDACPFRYPFRYSSDGIVEEPFNEDCDIVYTTYEFNNLFKMQTCMPNVLPKCRYCILDVSYLTIDQIKAMMASYPFEKHGNLIIIGSFDKLYGCGLRLGFAMFNASLSEMIWLQRENFLNSGAYEFMKSIEYPARSDEDDKYFNMLKAHLENSKDRFQTAQICRNFLTFSLHEIDLYKRLLPYKMFTVDGHHMARFGMPSSQEELDQLMEVLA